MRDGEEVFERGEAMTMTDDCQCDFCVSARNFGFSVGHESDCSVHNPAYLHKRCDCWISKVGRNGNDLIICPLCGEKDMDALGFKIHLTYGHCDPWEKIILK